MSNQELIKNFEIYLLNEKLLSEKTLNYYIKDLNNFFEILDNKNILEINEKDIENYIKFSMSRNKKNTVLRKLSTVKIFLNYLFLKNKLNILININQFNKKIMETSQEILNLDDFKNLLNEIRNDTVEGNRDKLFIKILFYTNAKLSEVLEIKLEDFFLNNHLRIEKRIIILDEELIEDINYYIKNIRINLLDKEKNKFLFYDLNRNLFWNRLKMYAKKANINKNVSARTLIFFFKKNLNDLEINKILEMKNLNNKKTSLKQLYNNIKIGD